MTKIIFIKFIPKTIDMKILKRILLGILALVALILIVAAFAPKEFTGKSEIVINKPQQEVYNYIKFLKNQDHYGTWNKMDPEMKKSYEGTDGTVGFAYSWDSEKFMVGKGKQVITELNGSEMKSDLFFADSDDAAKSVMSTTKQGENQTLVKWSVNGKSPYPWNIMNLFFNMDGEFEKGLQNLKTELEK